METLKFLPLAQALTPVPGVPGRGRWQQVWKQTLDSNIGRSPIGPLQGSKGMGLASFHFPRGFPKKMWKANCLSCGDYFSLKVLLVLNQMLEVPPPIPLPPLLPALLHFVPFNKHRTQRSRAYLHFSGSSWGLPSTFVLLHSSPSYLIAPHLNFHCPLAPQFLSLQTPLHRLPDSF